MSHDVLASSKCDYKKKTDLLEVHDHTGDWISSLESTDLGDSKNVLSSSPCKGGKLWIKPSNSC